ncbi:hypothetical protein ABW19_dt0200367 [Dactylella cylindrospora]|nr:hypothetical protein ABW19_dt0200367 [Dactylella cylindrospora]
MSTVYTDQLLDVEGRGRRSEDTLISRSSPDFDDDRPDHEKATLLPSPSTSTPAMFAAVSTSPRKFGIIPRIRHTFARILMYLLPSFIAGHITPTNHQRSGKLSPTAWLDGLRGLACFIVVVYHSTYIYFASQEAVYDGVKNTNFLQLPIVKLIHSGPPMVKIFYIISGFALTCKAVSLTRVSGPIDTQSLLGNLSSSIWKRYLRLYLPCAASFILCALMVSVGMFEVLPKGRRPRWIRGKVEPRPPMEAGVLSQLRFSFWDFHQFAVENTFFQGAQSYVTDIHLWTIPVEFRESISLFIIVAGGCMLKRYLRTYVIMPLLFCFLIYHAKWELCLFLFGYFLAELHSDMVQKPTVLPTESTTVGEKQQPRRPHRFTIVYIFTLLLGFYFTSYPYAVPDATLTTGYGFLHSSTPHNYIRTRPKHKDNSRDFWQSIGACLVVWSIMHLPRIQTSILCNKVAQYLGKISFSLYLIHGHINRTLGYYVVTSGWNAVGIWYWDRKNHQGEVVNGCEGLRTIVVLAAFFITTPASIWCSDVFWRAIDMQSVRFVRWLEGKIKR